MGKKKPLKEVMRENKRMITRAVRELDREKQQLEKEEQRLTIEIKKAAKANQMGSVKIMAKVRVISLCTTCGLHKLWKCFVVQGLTFSITCLLMADGLRFINSAPSISIVGKMDN